ncbi:hypothetical protein AB0P17_30125 [Streptomyces sp. NPDC088124]|uniref:hypothetical protein n=1 Tax=Streptomyces sp. NPDC088124 TaxID=3154654 RepID=UPI0034369E3C
MITARPPFGIARARHVAGSLRMLWLAALLIGFVYTHGPGAGSVAGHVAPHGTALAAAADAAVDVHGGAGTPAVAVSASRGGHDPDGPSHPATECVPGQPQSAQAQAAPCPTPRVWGPGAVIPAGGKYGARHSVPAAPSSAEARGPVVLRV